MARYTHCTRFSAATESAVLSKKAYDPSTGPTTVPIALKDWAKLMRISEYLGGPQTMGFQSVCDHGTIGLFSFVETIPKFELLSYQKDTDLQPFPKIPNLTR